jgi:protein-disulfide isomerase
MEEDKRAGPVVTSCRGVYPHEGPTMSQVLRRAIFTLIVSLSVAPAVRAQPLAADDHQFVFGDPKAKVTIIEYISLTCPHCAHFQTAEFPEIKKNYINTGKIRFVLRDFPLDGLATAAALIVRCVAPDKGLKLTNLLLQNQDDWLSAKHPIDSLRSYAGLVGVDEAAIEGCLENRALLKTLLAEKDRAAAQRDLDMTPSFFIGDEKIEGDPGYEDLADAIDRQLRKAKN